MARPVPWPSANSNSPNAWKNCPALPNWTSAAACWWTCRATSNSFASVWKPSSVPAARTGAWPRPSTCCAWPACASRRCRISTAPPRWCRLPTISSASRMTPAPTPPASNWRRAWWPCAPPRSRTAPACSCNWAPCASRPPGSTRWCRRSRTRAACSSTWPPKAMAAAAGPSGWKSSRTTSVSS
ncbi:hypothetical protein D3C85_1162370 [compost metagenome]